ncbi:MAG: hypothetical protein PWR27_835 [Petroclostridium sp.]|uniref:helix-turn-helix domain-containing protein n=1 Tax=Petroclostridium xylanilyticum TaxID=1792311 RepID=UPI0018E3EC77|nr:AraC family transcriptional regulator [Petroclostridium xylanilyticum]MBZ4644947.1 hypothetical protein [Clostridia bacterium]MDK2810126.1 hypothetical protein [Petroclostridium sp.]
MKIDLLKASRNLSELDLKIIADNLLIDVLWFRAMVNEGDWIINRHTHSTYEFHFISSGCCRVILDGGEFKASAGEFYLTAPGIHHEQRNIGKEKFIEYSLNCDISLIEDKISEAYYLIRILRETPCMIFKDSQGAIRLFDKALGEAHQQNIGFYNNIKSIVVQIITAAARAMNRDSAVRYDVPFKRKKDDYRFLQIQKFIEDNISNPISTIDVARYMCLSDKQVCRIIKERMGISTKDFILQMKLKKSKELLENTGLSIKEIADALGFSSEYYFSQFFKRHEGFPPGIFRDNVQNVQKY